MEKRVINAQLVDAKLAQQQKINALNVFLAMVLTHKQKFAMP